MEILTGQIGCGKTKELIKMAYENHGTIVTMNKCSVEAMEISCKEVGKEYNNSDYNNIPIISYHKLLNLRCVHDKKYYIDNIEYFLESILPGQIKGFSCNGENIIIKERQTDVDGKTFYTTHKLVK